MRAKSLVEIDIAEHFEPFKVNFLFGTSTRTEFHKPRGAKQEHCLMKYSDCAYVYLSHMHYDAGDRFTVKLIWR